MPEEHSQHQTKPTNRRLQISLRTLLVLVVLASLLLVTYLQWKKIDFQFEEYSDYYSIEMLNKIEFFDQTCHIYVVLEEGKTAPTLRQRWLIYQLQHYDDSLRTVIDDAADEHRVNFEGAVGDLTEEYGLPVMNRENINQHYGVGGIVIPRLTGSPDDYIVLGCDCTWEQEHGMEILVKNGSTVPWHGEEGPWEWDSAWEFDEELEAKNK